MAVAWSWEKTRQWLLLASPALGKLLVAAGYYSMAQRDKLFSLNGLVRGRGVSKAKKWKLPSVLHAASFVFARVDGLAL